MRATLNSLDWIRDLSRGHAATFAAGALFQLFLLSFLTQPQTFLAILAGFLVGVAGFSALWIWRRRALQRGNHPALRTGWWDLFPILLPPILALAWRLYDSAGVPSEITVSDKVVISLLLLCSLLLQGRSLLRTDWRLTDAFVACLKRVRGADASYDAVRVNYRSRCLTLAGALLAMLLYNGGGDYADVSLTTHVLRMTFLAFSLAMTSAVTIRMVKEGYFPAAGEGGEPHASARIMGFLRRLPLAFWLLLLLTATTIVCACMLGREYWYATMTAAFAQQLLACHFFHQASGRTSWLWTWFVLHPVYLLVISFLALILVGTFLFELPFCYVPMAAEGALPQTALLAPTMAAPEGISAVPCGPMPLVDALFTAASAVCITGMTTIELSRFPLGGRVVLCVLIQLGALGVMTISSFFAVLARQRLGLMGSSLVSRVAGEDRGRLAKQMVRSVVLLTLVLETIGTAVLSTYFRHVHGLPALQALGHGFFMALNSFCNAGFEIWPGGFTANGLSDALPMLTAAVLFVLGGLGFGVLTGIWRWLFHDSVHSQTPQVRLVLWGSVLLILLGMGTLLLSEWTNPATLGELSAPRKCLYAFFASASSRSAGYEALPLDQLRPPAALVTRILIFIGAAPGSTGGGIRVTTIGVLLMLLWSIVRRREDVALGRSSISTETVRQAVAVLCLGILTACVGTLLLSFVLAGRGLTLGQLSFETVSAMSTVGMSLGVVAKLNVVGKLIFVVLMFLGRVGFVTVLSAVSGGARTPRVKYPEWRVMIG